MIETTSYDPHWILDNPFSDVNYNKQYSSHLINIFNTQILNRNQFSNEEDSLLGFKDEEDSQFDIQNKADFSSYPDYFLPKFSEFSSHKIRNYIANSQKWVGYITELNKDFYTARLEDITHGGTYEVGDFFYDEVSKEDREYLKLGAIFYWSVGHSVRNGQVIKESIVRFQRLPKWTEDDYNEALDRANDLNQTLKWD